MGRPLLVSLPRPSRRLSSRVFLVTFLLASLLAWVLFYFIPASPWNRWYPPAWHPAVYNPPPALNPKWWRFFTDGRRKGTGPRPPHPSARVQPPSSPFFTAVKLPCAEFPGAQDVLVVMKTGAIESHARLPAHFNATFRCVPYFDIYSDLDEMLEGYTIHNALDEMDSNRIITYPEFELYQEQFIAKRRGRKDVAGLSHVNDMHAGKEATLTWKLDRWKLLPMMEKALITKPGAKWFFFVEADTAILWSNLLLWLATLQHSSPQWLGAQTALDGGEFAHSGAGFLLSNAALRAAVDAVKARPAQYDSVVSDVCCGDVAAARVLRDAGVPLTPSRPLLQSDSPAALAFSPALWCRPVVTLHHMSPAAVRDVWDFEQDWLAGGARAPLLHRDVFARFVAPELADSRTAWDNLSGDRVLTGRADLPELSPAERAARRSPRQCAALCDGVAECLQWRHRRNECALGFAVRLGAAQARAGGDVLATSGWRRDRISTLIDGMAPCEDAQWSAVEGFMT